MKHENPQVSLNDFSLLKDLSGEHLRDVAAAFTVKVLRKNDTLYTTAENRIYFIHSGVVKLIETNESGEEYLKDVLAEGDLFGNHLEPRDHFEYAEVLSAKAVVIHIHQERLRAIMRDTPAVAFNFQRTLIRRIEKLESRNALLAVPDSKKRLLYLLRNLACKDSRPSSGNLVLENYLTQDELAKMILISRQTFSRLLKDLRRAGIVTYNRNRIEIRDGELQTH